MTLRRYSTLKPSAGTQWPPEVKRAILTRDGFACVSERAGLPVLQSCWGNAGLEVDHIRASHGIGMKSESTVENGATLCNPCHQWKTNHGKVARPLLLAYVDAHPIEEPHARCVDPCSSVCPAGAFA